MSTAKDCPPQALSERTAATYAADWALFTDWCTSTGNWELPADPATVLGFVTDCPGPVATQRVRVAAIDHQHTAAGHPKPGEHPAVRAALGRRTRQASPPSADTQAAVDAAVRALPTTGWTSGMFGRRDQCLLVLSQLAGVPYRDLARLTAGDITMASGIATISAKTGTWTLLPGDDALLCGSCAVVRWLRILDLVVTRPGTRDLGQALKNAKAVTGGSPHLCRSKRQIDQGTTTVPLLPPIDQWGYIPFPVQRLTPHSLSRRVRDLLDGDFGAHRDLPVDTDDEPETPAPAAPSASRAVYSREDAQRAWARRRADLADIAGFDDILNQIGARAEELQQRTAAILAAETDR